MCDSSGSLSEVIHLKKKNHLHCTIIVMIIMMVMMLTTTMIVVRVCNAILHTYLPH
jgi:hypothetical protein